MEHYKINLNKLEEYTRACNDEVDAILKDIYNTILNENYYERVMRGRYELDALMDYFIIDDADEIEKKSFIILLLRDVIASDGYFKNDEYNYICDVFELELDYDEVLQSFQNLDDDSRAEFKGYVMNAPDEIRLSFVSLAICVCASDEIITPEEHEVIKNYF